MAPNGLCGWGLVVAAVLVSAQVVGAQQANAAGDGAAALAAYDVVSVKPVDQNAKISFVGLQYTPDGIKAGHVTVGMLARAAFGGLMKVTADSVTGLPDWAKTEAFDVEAKMSPEQAAEFAKLSKSDQEERREAMLRAVLEERFKLKVHREPKTVPDYELVVAKGGLKIKEDDAPDPNAPKGPDGKPITGGYLMMRKTGQIQAHAFGIESLANFLGQQPTAVGRMVKDKTGLTGMYSFTLNWTSDAALGSGSIDGLKTVQPAATEDGGPSIFTALQEQLGLKLQPGTAAIDLVVVDHVERPSPD